MPEWRYLWRDVIFAMVPAWTRGGNVYDLARRVRADTQTSGISHSVSHAGRSLLSDGTTDENVIFNDDSRWPAAAETGRQGSWLCYFQTAGGWTAGKKGMLMMRAEGPPDFATNGVSITVQAAADGGEIDAHVRGNSGYVNQVLTGSKDVADDVPHLMGFDWNQVTTTPQRLYVDGAPDGSFTSTAAWTFDTQLNLYLFDSPFTTWVELAGHIYYAMWVNRNLTAAEHRKLAADPWGPFRQAAA